MRVDVTEKPGAICFFGRDSHFVRHKNIHSATACLGRQSPSVVIPDTTGRTYINQRFWNVLGSQEIDLCKQFSGEAQQNPSTTHHWFEFLVRKNCFSGDFPSKDQHQAWSIHRRLSCDGKVKQGTINTKKHSIS